MKNSVVLALIFLCLVFGFQNCSSAKPVSVAIQNTLDSSGDGGESSGETELLGYWKFDEASGNALNSVGNEYIGFLENGTTRYQGSQSGNKALFDGKDDRITIPISGVDGAVSFTAWVRPESNAGAIARLGNSLRARFHFGITKEVQAPSFLATTTI